MKSAALSDSQAVASQVWSPRTGSCAPESRLSPLRTRLRERLSHRQTASPQADISKQELLSAQRKRSDISDPDTVSQNTFKVRSSPAELLRDSGRPLWSLGHGIHDFGFAAISCQRAKAVCIVMNRVAEPDRHRLSTAWYSAEAMQKTLKRRREGRRGRISWTGVCGRCGRGLIPGGHSKRTLAVLRRSLVLRR